MVNDIDFKDLIERYFDCYFGFGNQLSEFSDLVLALVHNVSLVQENSEAYRAQVKKRKLGEGLDRLLNDTQINESKDEISFDLIKETESVAEEVKKLCALKTKVVDNIYHYVTASKLKSAKYIETIKEVSSDWELSQKRILNTIVGKAFFATISPSLGQRTESYKHVDSRSPFTKSIFISHFTFEKCLDLIEEIESIYVSPENDFLTYPNVLICLIEFENDSFKKFKEEWFSRLEYEINKIAKYQVSIDKPESNRHIEGLGYPVVARCHFEDAENVLICLNDFTMDEENDCRLADVVVHNVLTKIMLNVRNDKDIQARVEKIACQMNPSLNYQKNQKE